MSSGARNIQNIVVMESKKRSCCWDRDGDLGKEWCPGGVVPASFSCTQAVFAGGLGWVSPLPPSPRQPGSRTAPARVHCVPGSAIQARLTLCSLPAPRFEFAESTLGLDTLPPPPSPPVTVHRENPSWSPHPWQHTPTPTAASHGGPKPPLGLASLELRLGSMPGYKETSLGSSPSWHPPSRLVSVLYTSAFLSLPFFSPI